MKLNTPKIILLAGGHLTTDEEHDSTTGSYRIIAVQVLTGFYISKTYAGGGTKNRKRISKSGNITLALQFIPGLWI